MKKKTNAFLKKAVIVILCAMSAPLAAYTLTPIHQEVNASNNPAPGDQYKFVVNDVLLKHGEYMRAGIDDPCWVLINGNWVYICHQREIAES